MRTPNLNVTISSTKTGDFSEKGADGCTFSRWFTEAPTDAIRYAGIAKYPGGLAIEIETAARDRCLVSCPSISHESPEGVFTYEPDLFTVAVLRPNIARALVLCHGSASRDYSAVRGDFDMIAALREVVAPATGVTTNGASEESEEDGPPSDYDHDDSWRDEAVI